MIYDPVDVRISVSNTNVRSDGGGGGEVSRVPGPSPGSAAVLYERPAPPWGICRFSKTEMTNAKQIPKSFCPKPLEAFLK